jgi:hypothetical protein
MTRKLSNRFDDIEGGDLLRLAFWLEDNGFKPGYVLDLEPNGARWTVYYLDDGTRRQTTKVMTPAPQALEDLFK